MSRLRLCLASLLLAATTSACAPNLSAQRTTIAPTAPAKLEARIDRAAVRAKLAARREHTMQGFLAYRDAQIYPMNNLPGGGFRHVWVDSANHLCAAATLVSKDWGRDASIRVGNGNVEIRLADIHDGALADWMLTTGMTHAELVAIQAPGFMGRENQQIQELPVREAEVLRLYQLYIDVERQMRSLWDENLDHATDELMQHPEVARALLRDQIAGPGVYARDGVRDASADPAPPEPAPAPEA